MSVAPSAIGRFVDPMRIKLPRGRSLDGPLMANFEKERDRLDAGQIVAGISTGVGATRACNGFPADFLIAIV
jgi:hypothetical protein